MEAGYCKVCGSPLPLQTGRGRRLTQCLPPKGCKYKAYRGRLEFRGATKFPQEKQRLDLIFCAGDNREFFQVASEAGYMLGIRSGRQAYGYDIQFVDIDYKRRNFEKHLKVVTRYQPRYATVLDLSDEEISDQDIERAMSQYQLLANYCQVPLIVPKLPGQIAMFPSSVAIGYSIPTSYGGARYELWELQGRRIHLLGGSPHEQMDIYKKLAGRATVTSADGNMAMMVARSFSEYWDAGQWIDHPQKGTPGVSLYLDCWKRSCENIRREWERLAELQPRFPQQLTLV